MKDNTFKCVVGFVTKEKMARIGIASTLDFNGYLDTLLITKNSITSRKRLI